MAKEEKYTYTDRKYSIKHHKKVKTLALQPLRFVFQAEIYEKTKLIEKVWPEKGRCECNGMMLFMQRPFYVL